MTDNKTSVYNVIDMIIFPKVVKNHIDWLNIFIVSFTMSEIAK